MRTVFSSTPTGFVMPYPYMENDRILNRFRLQKIIQKNLLTGIKGIIIPISTTQLVVI